MHMLTVGADIGNFWSAIYVQVDNNEPVLIESRYAKYNMYSTIYLTTLAKKKGKAEGGLRVLVDPDPSTSELKNSKHYASVSCIKQLVGRKEKNQIRPELLRYLHNIEVIDGEIDPDTSIRGEIDLRVNLGAKTQIIKPSHLLEKFIKHIKELVNDELMQYMDANKGVAYRICYGTPANSPREAQDIFRDTTKAVCGQDTEVLFLYEPIASYIHDIIDVDGNLKETPVEYLNKKREILIDIGHGTAEFGVGKLSFENIIPDIDVDMIHTTGCTGMAYASAFQNAVMKEVGPSNTDTDVIMLRDLMDDSIKLDRFKRSVMTAMKQLVISGKHVDQVSVPLQASLRKMGVQLNYKYDIKLSTLRAFVFGENDADDTSTEYPGNVLRNMLMRLKGMVPGDTTDVHIRAIGGGFKSFWVTETVKEIFGDIAMKYDEGEGVVQGLFKYAKYKARIRNLPSDSSLATEPLPGTISISAATKIFTDMGIVLNGKDDDGDKFVKIIVKNNTRLPTEVDCADIVPPFRMIASKMKQSAENKKWLMPVTILEGNFVDDMKLSAIPSGEVLVYDINIEADNDYTNEPFYLRVKIDVDNMLTVHAQFTSMESRNQYEVECGRGKKMKTCDIGN